MIDKSLKERLSGLEGKMEVLLGLLKEISDVTNDQPSREEFRDLHDRVVNLENNITSTLIKVGIISGIFGGLGGITLTLVFKYIFKVF
jgi:hypothetical protein